MIQFKLNDKTIKCKYFTFNALKAQTWENKYRIKNILQISSKSSDSLLRITVSQKC